MNALEPFTNPFFSKNCVPILASSLPPIGKVTKPYIAGNVDSVIEVSLEMAKMTKRLCFLRSNLQIVLLFVLILLSFPFNRLTLTEVSASYTQVTIDRAELLFNGYYTQSSGSANITIYISTSQQVTGRAQGTIIPSPSNTTYVDVADSPVRYGNLSSPGQIVGQFTCLNEPDPYLGMLAAYDITFYVNTHGIVTYYVAVDNPDADISFRASILIHFNNGTEVHYPMLTTYNYGNLTTSQNKGSAGEAAEMTLVPITDNYTDLLSQFTTLQSQHSNLQTQYSQLQNQFRTILVVVAILSALIGILTASTGYFLVKSRRKHHRTPRTARQQSQFGVEGR